MRKWAAGTSLFILFIILPLIANAEFTRTKIAVLDFQLQGEDFETPDFGAIVAEWFITALVKVGRFDVIERGMLNRIIEEQKLGMSGMVDETTASQIGKLLGVPAIISGSVMKFRNVLEINARIIDIETASIKAAESVKSSTAIRLQDLVVQMVDKIVKNFPLQGYVIQRNQKQASIDLGYSAGVMIGMEFIAYKEGKTIKHPKTGEVLDVEQIETGRLKIIDVRSEISTADIVKENLPLVISYGQMVYSVTEPSPQGKAPLTKSHPPNKAQLYVTVTPPDARIRILNIVSPYQPGISLDPGNYQLEVTAPEYQPYKEWITVKSGENKRLIVILNSISPKASPVSQTTEPFVEPKKDKATGLSPTVSRYIFMIKSGDTRQITQAAKRLISSGRIHPAIFEAANQVLRQGYKKEPIERHHVDAMSWLCKVLGASGKPQYRTTLEEVVKGANHRKLKGYASKNLNKLK